MKRIYRLLVWGATLAVFTGSVAQSAHSQDSKSLQTQIKALADEVAVLKTQVASLEKLKPTFAEFMPDFSERFHVMHLAGQDGDWAVAAHELMEMNRMVRTAKEIDAKNGQLMQGFLAGGLQSLKTAIDHGNLEKFNKALGETLTSCNNCHKAAGSPFIKISLDVHKMLSMRHSHALQKSKIMGGHMH